MQAHPEQFKTTYKAHTLRMKASAFEIPAMQHAVRGDTIRVPADEESLKIRWTFYLPEILAWQRLGKGKRTTKEIVRSRDYAKMIKPEAVEA
jgi:hypothetical protein